MKKTFALAAMLAALSAFAAPVTEEQKAKADGYVAHLKEIESLPTDEWIDKIGDVWQMFDSFCKCGEEYRRIGLEKVADRIYKLDRSEKKYADLQNRVRDPATRASRESRSEDLRRKQVEYYRVVGDKFNYAEKLWFEYNDIEAARKAFAAVEGEKKGAAQNWLAALADEADPTPQIEYARQELTNWVTKISGKAPDMEKFVLGTPKTNPEIADFAKKHKNDFARLAGNDGFIIAEEGGFLGFGSKKIYIAADRAKGVLNGVYRFLEKNSDIIWVRPMNAEDGCGTIYSKNPDFRNTIKYLADVPSIPLHRSVGMHGNSIAWAARNLNSATYSTRTIDNPVGDFMSLNKYGDTAERQLALTLDVLDKYRESDPDVFALLENGKRDFGHDHQLCFMNPKTAELMAKEICEKLNRYPKCFNGVMLGQGDNWSLCNCKEWCSSRIDCGNGKFVEPTDKNFRSTQYTLFISRVSRLVREKHPNIRPFATGSYLFTAEPAGIEIESHCAGGYCPYIKNHKRPVYDDVINKQWHDKAEGVFNAGMYYAGLYEYYLCTSTPHFYHAISEVAQLDLQYYLKHGLKSYYLDTNTEDGKWYNDLWHHGWYSMNVSAIEYYVISRLMWNANIDVRETRREFCRRAYQDASDLMIEFVEKMAENYNSDPAGCFWNDDPVSAAKHYVVEKNLAPWARDILSRAEAKASHPGSKELIRLLREQYIGFVDKAEKMPSKVELRVGKDWTEVAPLTAVSHADKPAKEGVKMWVKNDNKHLWLKLQSENAEGIRKMSQEAKEKGTFGKATDNFDWCHCAELFIDGGLAKVGGYHHFGFSFTGALYNGICSSKSDQKINWTCSIEPYGEKGVVCELCWPLDEIGVDISKGNKIGVMFLFEGSAWNGGQWHSPTGFQILALGME